MGCHENDMAPDMVRADRLTGQHTYTMLVHMAGLYESTGIAQLGLGLNPTATVQINLLLTYETLISSKNSYTHFLNFRPNMTLFLPKSLLLFICNTQSAIIQ